MTAFSQKKKREKNKGIARDENERERKRERGRERDKEREKDKTNTKKRFDKSYDICDTCDLLYVNKTASFLNWIIFMFLLNL